uniref:Uncharacterized protein n=1 Tax=Rhizophora mucronata TaxID=61149 RepID=A0A2P2P3U0_RHIMU
MFQAHLKGSCISVTHITASIFIGTLQKKLGHAYSFCLWFEEDIRLVW